MKNLIEVTKGKGGRAMLQDGSNKGSYGFLYVLLLALFCISPASGATRASENEIKETGSVPILRVYVVERTAKAINYRHRSGATTIDFRGTTLLPEAYGEAKVESKKGYIEIEVEFDDMPPASQFGPEYLTYVLWAISPEGRPSNLGEILLDDSRDGKLNVTTELQAFGLLVTAEPYFAVTQPSDLVVMENVVRKDTVGKIEEIDAKYELLQRGQYVLNVNAAEIRPIILDKKTPLELHEARNALRIARWAGADRFAVDSFQKAETLLRQAEDYQAQEQSKKSVIMVAREAAQTAEDARLIALKRQDEERQAAERAASAEREARARLEAEREARLRDQAEAERRAAERAQVEAERERRAAERAQLEAERAKQQAEAAKNVALVQQQAIQAEAERARLTAQEAEREKAELRAQIRQQLNMILETRDSARGLIVNMSDVLFDTGKHSLRPGAREKLAKIAGILLSHPGLKLEVEGHTDSRGSEEYNQQLSEDRADAVRDYLVQQSVPMSLIAAKGFGETQPLVSNDSAAGRQQNRRVELIVSGEAIS